jgi:hypothetical protein
MKTSCILASPVRCLLLLVILSVGSVSATDPPILWNRSDGTPVRLGHHFEWQGSVLQGQPGEMIIAWSDAHLGGRDLYAQKVDVNSPNQPFQWSSTSAEHGEVDALLVRDGSLLEKSPVLCTDGQGGAIVSWLDINADYEGSIYVNRLIDGAGEGQMAWGESGVLICDEFCIEAPRCDDEAPPLWRSHCTDTMGGAWIAWSDVRSSSWDVYVTHVLADGSIDPNFDLNGRLVAGGEGYEREFALTQDGVGGAFITWILRVSGEPGGLFIEHFCETGEPVYGGSGRPVVSNMDVYSPRIEWDGLSGCYVAWEDTQNGLYTTDIYVQHFNDELYPSYAEGGVAIANQPGVRKVEPQLLHLGEDDVLLMWSSLDPQESGWVHQLRLQKMDSETLYGWGENGVPAVCAGSVLSRGSITRGEEGGCFVAYTVNYDSGRLSYAQKLSPTGSLEWGEGGVLLRSHTSMIDHLAISSDSEGGLLLAWENDLPDYGLYTQHLNSLGERQFEDDGLPAATGFHGSAHDVKNLAVSDAVLTFWIDGRIPDEYHVCMQRSHALTGEVELAPGGVIVDESLDGRLWGYSVHSDQVGGAYLLLQCPDHVFAIRVDSFGQQLWDAPVEVYPSAALWLAESLTVGGNLVVASICVIEENEENAESVFLQVITPEGNILFPEGGVLVDSSNEDAFVNAIVSAPNHGFWLLWSKGPGLSVDLKCQLFDVNGVAQLETDALLISDFFHWGMQACAGLDGGMLVTWEDDDIFFISGFDASANLQWSTSLEEGTYIRHIPILSDGYGGAFIICRSYSEEGNRPHQLHVLADGSLLWQDEQFPLVDYSNGTASAVVPRGGHHGLVFAYTNHRDLYIRDSHVNPHGEIEGIPYDGVVIQAPGSQISPYLSYDQGDGVYLSWEDARSEDFVRYSDAYTTRIAFTSTDLERDAVMERGFQLAAGYPNPFNPTTTFEYQLLRPMEIKLSVYNIQGQLVRVLKDELVSAGSHRQTFDARSISGSALSSGMYIMRLEAEGFEQCQKMLLVK